MRKLWDGRGYNGRESEEGVYFYRMLVLDPMVLILRKMEVLH